MVASNDERDPLHLDESQPQRSRIPAGTTSVWIGNPEGRPLDLKRLRDALERQGERKRVRELVIDWTSRMASPAVIDLFPKASELRLKGPEIRSLDELLDAPQVRNLTIGTHRSSRRNLEVLPKLRLEVLTLHIAKPSDVEYLSQCRALETLGLLKWRDADLTPIREVDLRYLEVIGGAIQSAEGVNPERLLSVEFRLCTKLTSVAGICVRSLTLDACSRMELNTLGSVEQLRILRIQSMKLLDSFEFVRSCPDLCYLTVTATKIDAELGPIVQSRSLRWVWLPAASVKSEQIRAMAAANRRLSVSNGDVSFIGGEPVTGEQYAVERVKFLEQLRQSTSSS